MMDEVTGLLYICSGVWPFLRTEVLMQASNEIHGEQKFREVSIILLSHGIGAQFQHIAQSVLRYATLAPCLLLSFFLFLYPSLAFSSLSLARVLRTCTGRGVMRECASPCTALKYHEIQVSESTISQHFFHWKDSLFAATTNPPPKPIYSHSRSYAISFPKPAIHKFLTHFVSTLPKSHLPQMPKQISGHTKHPPTGTPNTGNSAHPSTPGSPQRHTLSRFKPLIPTFRLPKHSLSLRRIHAQRFHIHRPRRLLW